MAGFLPEHVSLKHGIARKLIIYLILFSSVITILGTSFQVYLEYTRDIQYIEKRMAQIE